MTPWIFPLIGFLLGSIPFGILISRAHGIDIRQHGSGNIGATNVLRTLGRKAGISCLLLDALKGLLPTLLAIGVARASGTVTPHGLDALFRWFGSPDLLPRESAQFLHVATGLAAILGHNYSPWVAFRGGKGIATSAGVLIALYPVVGLLIVIMTWILLFFATRYVSVASMGAAIALPGLTLWGSWHHGRIHDGTWNKSLFGLSLAIAILAVWRHRSNIRRLLDGTESRFERKPRTKSHISAPKNPS